MLRIEVASRGVDLGQGGGGEVCRDARRDVGDLKTGDLGELAVRSHGFDAELDRGCGGATGEVVEPARPGGALDDDPSNRAPKYLNSPDTALFSKRRQLYGLSEKREPVSPRCSTGTR